MSVEPKALKSSQALFSIFLALYVSKLGEKYSTMKKDRPAVRRRAKSPEESDRLQTKSSKLISGFCFHDSAMGDLVFWYMLGCLRRTSFVTEGPHATLEVIGQCNSQSIKWIYDVSLTSPSSSHYGCNDMQRMDERIVKPGSGELFDVFSSVASCHSPIIDCDCVNGVFLSCCIL